MCLPCRWSRCYCSPKSRPAWTATGLEQTGSCLHAHVLIFLAPLLIIGAANNCNVVDVCVCEYRHVKRQGFTIILYKEQQKIMVYLSNY